MSTIARGRHVRDPRHPVVTVLVRGVATGLAAVLVVGVTAGAVLMRQLDGNIQAADVTDLIGENRPTPVAEAEKALNILVMGADRAGQETDELGQGAQDRRADTTILLHLAADRSRANLVSIPRDSMVTRPDCDLADGTTSPGGLVQFNSAFATGGAACTIATVEAVTDVRINHYVVVDYDGFMAIVDAVGGVRVCLPEAVEDSKSGLALPAGEQVVAGEQALAYVRLRNVGDGSDLGRIERQQAFLSSMIQEVTSTGLLTRPDRLIGVLDAGTKSLTTDPELASVTELAGIARSVQALPPEDVSFLTIPNEPWPEDENRVVWTPDADLVWEALRNDTPLPGEEEPEPEPSPAATSAAPEEPLTVSPDEFVVDVVNAGAPGGWATDTATDLRTQGFQVGAVLNGEEDVDGIRVLVPTGQDEAARTVAAAFPDAELVRDGDVATITVQLGDGAGFVQEVENRLGTVPLPERTLPEAPTPSIEVRAADEDICG
ncbi:LCP family protein [Jannaschia sp. R86511]|uniref:LCP family protein n=1 Tax=Jannaschia sp. R86511 TaxID=3093853 RepID=UPI0036D2B718